MLVEIKISIPDDINNNSNITSEKIVCLSISNFIFSFRLSFIIDLYSLKPLTAKASIAGITKKLWKSRLLNIKINPFDIPKVVIHADIVYPRQNPL